jgi:hypothetical protein
VQLFDQSCVAEGNALFDIVARLAKIKLFGESSELMARF